MNKTTILIVEDEAIVAADLAGKLGMLGYEVVGAAATGEDAVDLACSLKPAVVLMDIRLKGSMDGIETAEAIRRRHDVPIIYLTAHSDSATLERAKFSGPFGYILKPFEERELSTTIEMAVYKHQSERQLREQKEWLRVTLASIGDAVITCDTDGWVTFLNPLAEALTGWSVEKAKGLPIREVFRLINEETRGPAEDIVALVLRDGQTKTLANHTALVTRDGREVPIEDSAAPILAADGRVIGAVFVFHDVTEKRRAQDALRRSHDELERCVEERTRELVVAKDSASAERQRLYDVLETLPAMICLLTPDYHVAFSNKGFRDRFGESAGRHCYDYCFGKSEPCDFCESYKVLETGQPHHWEVKGEDGSVISAHDYPFTDTDGSPLILEMDIDITDQRRAEEAAKLANAYNRSLIEASVDPLVTIGHDGKITDVNNATEAATGRSRGELIGTDFSDFFSEPDKARAGYEQVFREGSVRDYPLDIRHRDGHLTSVLYNASVYRDDRGEVVGVFAAARDITEQKKAQIALKELNEELEGRVIERTAQLNSMNETLRASRVAALNLMEDAVIARREAEETSDKLRLEIAERKRAEQALQVSYQRTSLLAETTAKLLASDSPQKVVEELCLRVMEVLDCQAFFNFLVAEKTDRLRLNACAGIPEEELKNLEWLDFGVAVCGCAARDACRIVAEDIPNTPDPRTELVKSFGIRAYACHPLMAQGRVMGTLSFGTRSRPGFTTEELSLMKTVADHVAIAMERKRAEEDLKLAREAAEAASRAKSQFLANMSHELRTPMTGVLGMLEFTLGTPLEAQQRDCIETAYKSARKLLRILNDILDLARIEAGKLSIEAKPFGLRDCVAGAIDILMPEARRKGLELKCAMADDLPESVVGDQVRLLQVLTNLCGNAVKFTEQGKVEVKVTRSGGAPEATGMITFTVTDTGIGIPGDKGHLLFNNFSQVDDSDTRGYGGAGLGLAISRELVERMGGTIAFESTEGRGSTFTFTIPFEAPLTDSETLSMPVAPPYAASAPVSSSGKKKARLLLAEDDPITRQVIGMMLKHANFDHEIADNGLRAVEMWEKGNYDLVLMDVQMPGQDGFAATGAIRKRERERGGHTLIVAMTAHAFPEDEKRCLDAGMDAYIPKPIDLQQCIAVIEELIEKRAGEA